jgi:glutaredoxin
MEIKLRKNVIVRHQSVPDCEWCDKAKLYLDEKKLPYTVINSDKWFFGALMDVTKSKVVPQIIIDGEFVGDYNGMIKHFEGE